MGEVYRARDTRLDRAVAVKVLPSHLSASEEGRQRFEREARTISQLSHPHICALYDVGSDGGIEYLVMELLEGETLSDRLARGALPIDHVLRFGIEIADALDKAHRQGIVHRDLKPGNVMITKSGVKLLDFGLAKTFERSLDATGREQTAASQHPMAGRNLTALPTEIANVTREGTILGTFQYMAPEQLEGRDADARTDIFAFGAVLYEMATGRKAFSGKSQASLISSIMKEDPAPISTVQPMTPPALDRIVRTCLAKDPEDRFQTAHDVKLQLQWIAEGGSLAGAPAVIVSRRKSRERLAWAIAAVAVLAGALATYGYLCRAPVEARPMRAAILPPDKVTLDSSGEATGSLTISPDGRYVTFSAIPEGGKSQLWLRPVNSARPRPIDGTEGATWPFWSADGRFLAFFAGGKLKKVDVSGAPPLDLCDAPNGRSGSWNRDGVILFSPDSTSPIHRIPAGGGASAPVTSLDMAKNETTHRWATFLPDGRHFLFMAGTHAAGTRSEANAVYIGSLDSKERTLLLRARSNVEYASGYLLYVLESTLLAHPFDATRRELTGDPVPFEEAVLYDFGYFRASFSASGDGTLVFRTGSREMKAQLFWYDREGKQGAGPLGDPAEYDILSMSPDGKRLAMSIADPATGLPDIWILDLSRGNRTRFTFGPGPSTFPLWSPDGNRIAYLRVGRGLTSEVVIKTASGAGAEEVVLRAPGQWNPIAWSPEGRHIAFQVRHPNTKTKHDVWLVPLFGDRKPLPFLETEFGERGASFSPDGRWMSYLSDESGRDEIYVVAFPGPGGKWQVSTGGVIDGGWCRAANEILYLGLDRHAWSVETRAVGSDFDASAPRRMFPIPRSVNGTVTPRCDRFLIAVSPEATQSSSISLVSNWPLGVRSSPDTSD
jgi:Tol biopolymer transport system component